MGEVKQCKACGIVKPVTDFYFRKEYGGYRPACKQCKSVTSKEDIAARVAATTKVCKHCNKEKSVNEFQKAGGEKCTQPYCKECDKERKKKWSLENSDRLKEKSRKRYLEKIKPFYIKKGRKIISEEEKTERRRLYRNLPYVKAKKSITDKKYRENNYEKIKLGKKAHYDIKGLEQAKEWQRKNMSSIEFVTKKRLRGRVYVALKRGIKSESTMKLLGCSIQYFKEYFQNLFKDGMTWDAFMNGEIHIDHKIPCKHFNLSKPEEQKRCFHYTNLQPLWAVDNLKKGASIIL